MPAAGCPENFQSDDQWISIDWSAHQKANKALAAPQIVDLNGDKRPDLVFNYFANYDGSIKNAHKQIWMNKGNGKFKRLTKNIFSKVSGTSRKAKIVALHANKDKKIDWLVIWSDGTYGTLIAR